MNDRAAPIRVLLVEDNAMDARLIAELFRDVPNCPFRVAAADTLQKAGQQAAAAPPDAVILDLNLPDSRGAETLTRAAALLPAGTPVIVMTGLHEEGLGAELIKKGAQDYLVKGKITADWLAYSVRYSIERAKAQRELREREERLREILEKCPDGFVVLRPDRSVAFANRGAEQILGRTAEQLMRQPFSLQADAARTLETEVTRPNAAPIPVEVRAASTRWDGGDCLLVMLRDLEPVRALERNRDEFISMVSHELRSPLTVVKESLQLISDGVFGAPNEKQRELLEIGLDNAGRLNRLIDALLDMAKLEAGVMPMEVSGTDLREMAAAIARDYAYVAAEKKISLSAELQPGQVLTWCDADKVRQVLVNLVSNALKFTPGGGRILLSVKALSGTAVISVENSGPGIAPEDMPKLFRKFARLGSRNFTSVKGTGLGLAISRRIAEMHNGQIWAESHPGMGACFFVRLPVADGDGALQAAVARELNAGGGRFFCVLGAKAAPGAEPRLDEFLRTHLRAARLTVKYAPGEYALLLGDCDAAAGGRAAEVLRGFAGGQGQARAAALCCPGDFSDADGFARLWRGWRPA